MLLRFLLLACVLVTQHGCTSMSSTMLTRDESNQFWTRKSGLKGVPITLKVPTHVQLTVFERYFMVNNADGRAYRLKLPYVVRDFAQEFVYSEKIFTVDFKRAAAGTYNMHLDLTEDQYIQKLQLDVTDTTINRVTALVTALAPGGLAAVTASGEAEGYFEEIQSVVAVGMFEIEAPDFEDQMAQFVNCHLNQAHDAWIAPPDVTTIHRVGISGIKQPTLAQQPRVIPTVTPAAAMLPVTETRRLPILQYDQGTKGYPAPFPSVLGSEQR